MNDIKCFICNENLNFNLSVQPHTLTCCNAMYELFYNSSNEKLSTVYCLYNELNINISINYNIFYEESVIYYYNKNNQFAGKHIFYEEITSDKININYFKQKNKVLSIS